MYTFQTPWIKINVISIVTFAFQSPIQIYPQNKWKDMSKLWFSTQMSPSRFCYYSSNFQECCVGYWRIISESFSENGPWSRGPSSSSGEAHLRWLMDMGFKCLALLFQYMDPVNNWAFCKTDWDCCWKCIFIQHLPIYNSKEALPISLFHSLFSSEPILRKLVLKDHWPCECEWDVLSVWHLITDTM
jgi:hypothetical protein